MERLTLEEAIIHAKEVAEKNYRGADFESIDSIDDDIKVNCVKCAEEHEQLAKWLEELKSYKEAEEQGLLVRLPCKVGDLVFIIDGENICRRKVKSIKILSTAIEISTSDIIFHKESFGETVFLTREEAEKKLEEMRNE